jgi:hypothetical protein
MQVLVLHLLVEVVVVEIHLAHRSILVVLEVRELLLSALQDLT